MHEFISAGLCFLCGVFFFLIYAGKLGTTDDSLTAQKLAEYKNMFFYGAVASMLMGIVTLV